MMGTPYLKCTPSRVCSWALGTVGHVCPASQSGLGSHSEARYLVGRGTPSPPAPRGSPIREDTPGQARRARPKSGPDLLRGQAVGLKHASYLAGSFLFSRGQLCRSGLREEEPRECGLRANARALRRTGAGASGREQAVGSGTGSDETLRPLLNGLRARGWRR